MKKTYWILCFVMVLFINYVYGASCTSIPLDDCTVDASLQLRGNSIFYINDSNGNGALKINADDIDLDCNGSTIYGNYTPGSRGIHTTTTERFNITIRNCFIRGFDIGIISVYDNYSNIHNNTIYNNSINGIKLYGTDNVNVYNNKIYNTTQDGIYLTSSAENNSIYSNVIINVTTSKRGIFIESSDNNVIYSNNITNTFAGIQTNSNADYTNIYNNRIITTRWNGIDSDGHNSNISNNYLENIFHNCLDFFDSDHSQEHYVFNNVCNYTAVTPVADANGAYFWNASNITFISNSIYNSWRCIGIDSTRDQSFGRNINITNNYLELSANSGEYCLVFNEKDSDGFDNSTNVNGNTISASNGNHIRDGSNYSNYEGNTFSEGFANYKYYRASVNSRVNEISTSYHFVNLSNSGQITFNYNGIKDFTVTGNTISINNLNYPNNDIFNVSSGEWLALDQSSYTVTIAQDNELMVGDYTPPIITGRTSVILRTGVMVLLGVALITVLMAGNAMAVGFWISFIIIAIVSLIAMGFIQSLT